MNGGSLRCCLAALLILASGVYCLAEETSPEGTLKEHGLIRAKTYFIVASESAVLQNFDSRVRPTIARMAQAHMKWAKVLENEAMLEQATNYKDNLISEINSVSLTIPNMPQRNDIEKAQKLQAQRYLNELNAERNRTFSMIATLRSRQVPVAEKVRLEKEFDKEKSKFLAAASDLRPLADETMEEYAKLKEDDSVKNALNAYRAQTKAHLTLGPSKTFTLTIKTVKDAERDYSPETAAPKTKMKRKTLRG